jgi:hypothetical protein
VTGQAYELGLSEEEIGAILKFCGQDALLVGGQALAVWAQFFAIEPPGELADKVTLDVDFVGSRAVANALSAALRWRLYLPSMEDSTPQTAKVSITLPDGGVKQIDFLSSIAGLDTASIEARAVDLVLANGAPIRVLHPLDVLESRLRNLDLLPSKQNAVGRAQVKLAVGIMAKFLRVLLVEESVRVVLEAVERVADIAFDPRLSQLLLAEGIDLLDEVPVPEINSVPFRERRWPQLLAVQSRLAKKNAALLKRRAQLLKKKQTSHSRQRRSDR